MINKAIRVYFGQFESGMTAKVIRMLPMTSVMRLCTPKEILSANSRGMDQTLPSADRRPLGPYYHTIQSYVRRNA